MQTNKKIGLLIGIVIIVLVVVVNMDKPMNNKEKLSSEDTNVNEPEKLVEKNSNWKLFKDDKNVIEFKHDPSWSVAGVNSRKVDYDKVYVFVLSGDVSNEPCEDIGCSPKAGDRDELIKGSTLEGAPPISPWFKILRVRGDKWVSIQVTDSSKVFKTPKKSRGYLDVMPFEKMQKLTGKENQVYNNFIDSIGTLKFNE